MKHHFVETENAARYRASITMLEQRGAMEAGGLLVTARPGEGKSTVVDHWAVRSGAVYLRAKTEWTPHYMMLELAQALDVDTRGKSKDLFARVQARIAAEQVPIIIDEVEHALRNGAECLEQIRDISDLSEIIVVMIGMEQAKGRISRHMQLASRIGYVCEFKPATLADVKLVCDQLSEVSIADDLVQEIHTQSDGRMRAVLNAVSRAEMAGKNLQRGTVALDDLRNVPLCEDWQSRVRKGGAK
jgi:DNA transposition AAA+ family ATPase